MQTKPLTLNKPVRAIVMFGPPSDMAGIRPGEFYQVTLDPNMKSPQGNYLRFDQTLQGGELHGWQRADMLTVCEILGDAEPYKITPEGYELDVTATLDMMGIDHGKPDPA